MSTQKIFHRNGVNLSSLRGKVSRSLNDEGRRGNSVQVKTEADFELRQKTLPQMPETFVCGL